MATYRVRPSKPIAVMGAVLGSALIIFGVVQMTGEEGPPPAFMYLWVAFGLAIVGFNLWAAFAKKGHVNTIESDEGPPTQMGTTAERTDA